MSSDLVKALTGAFGALVSVSYGFYLFLTNKIWSAKAVSKALADKDTIIAAKNKEIEEWKAAYTAERTRADASVQAAQAANSVLWALHRQVGP